MDVRDTLNLAIAPYEPGKGFDQIMTLQKNLLSHYQQIEGLPPYPVNPHIKVNQILLKDFTARVTEEIGEAYESLIKGAEAISRPEGDSLSKIKYAYFNLYEEMADALHFTMELFIYLGIGADELKSYFMPNKAPGLDTDWLGFTYRVAEGSLANTYDLYHHTIIRNPDWATILGEVDFKNMALPTGRVLNRVFSMDNTMYLFPYLAWESTYRLQMARNALKNKPWKQSEMVSDGKVLETNVIKSFIYYLALCQLLGLNEENIYYLYCRKNHINQFRVKSKY